MHVLDFETSLGKIWRLRPTFQPQHRMLTRYMTEGVKPLFEELPDWAPVWLDEDYIGGVMSMAMLGFAMEKPPIDGRPDLPMSGEWFKFGCDMYEWIMTAPEGTMDDVHKAPLASLAGGQAPLAERRALIMAASLMSSNEPQEDTETETQTE